jgi:hypothetical protein
MARFTVRRHRIVHTFYTTTPGKRPDFRLVIAFLWHDGKSVDTEGNSYHPASRTWTELYVQNREHEDEVVTVSQYQESPLVLRVRSERQQLAARAAFFLASSCGGSVSQEFDGEYHSPERLLPLVGSDFDVAAAMQRAAQSPFVRSSFDNPFPNLDRETMLEAKAALGL